MQRLRHLFCTMGLFSFLFGGCGKQPSPPSTATPHMMPPGDISYSQLDITERFDDHLHLKPDDWIQTVALNKSVPSGKGLPPVDVSADEVYKAAERLSKMRESISISERRSLLSGLPYREHSACEVAHPLPEVRESVIKVWLGLI
jgi:hypothetical protein